MKKKYYLYKMNGTMLNVISIILLIIMLLITLLINKNIVIDMFGDHMLISYALLIPYFVLHEILHSIAYVINGADFKNITYGVHLEKGVLCCLCKQNISKKNILFSLMYPFVFIGIITYIIGLIINSPVLTLLSIANITGCSGDLIMFYDLIRLNNYEYSEYDDPTSFGIYTSNDLSNKRLFGLKYVGKKDKLDINDLRKVDISKKNLLFILIYILLIIVCIVL